MYGYACLGSDKRRRKLEKKKNGLREKVDNDCQLEDGPPPGLLSAHAEQERREESHASSCVPS